MFARQYAEALERVIIFNEFMSLTFYVGLGMILNVWESPRLPQIAGLMSKTYFR